MNAGMNAVLTENLKTLKLSTMIRNLHGHLRQAKQDQIGYDEFLLNLTEIEVQVRKENGRKRRSQCNFSGEKRYRQNASRNRLGNGSLQTGCTDAVCDRLRSGQ